MSSNHASHFHSARRKLVHANGHTTAIRSLLAPLEHEDNFPLEPIDPNDSGSLHRFRLCSAPAVPDALPLIVGDALTNLRASLDHAYWKARELRGGQLTTATKFPMRRKADQPSKTNEPDEVLRDLVVRVQPWDGSAPQWWQPHALNMLVNVDKHHDVLTTLVIPDNSWWGSPPGVTMSGTATFKTPVAPASFELSFETAESVAISEFDVHMQGTVGFSRSLKLDPAFDACGVELPDYLFRASVADILDSFSSFIDSTLDEFDRVFPGDSRQKPSGVIS